MPTCKLVQSFTSQVLLSTCFSQKLHPVDKWGHQYIPLNAWKMRGLNVNLSCRVTRQTKKNCVFKMGPHKGVPVALSLTTNYIAAGQMFACCCQ